MFWLSWLFAFFCSTYSIMEAWKIKKQEKNMLGSIGMIALSITVLATTYFMNK